MNGGGQVHDYNVSSQVRFDFRSRKSHLFLTLNKHGISQVIAGKNLGNTCPVIGPVHALLEWQSLTRANKDFLRKACSTTCSPCIAIEVPLGCWP
ncbi:hypothetical protein VTL71DRAFT_2035 [Oculimacula yallundae]|uniref:Uncharacterized protein n=1 Tax=Oculimacula yallundae TaxID=86028 RepID=A0ABR4CCF3_9HELO